MIIAGIDYSLTSPAICVHEGDKWDIQNCKFYYLVKKDLHVVTKGLLSGSIYPEYTSDCHRYDNLSGWAEKHLSNHKVSKVYMEGYAFGATGRVFQIAENTGSLKYKMWKNKLPFEVIAPTEIKKFATGKGNANKEKMFDAFFKETYIDMFDALSIKNRNNWNPVSDIIDAYYIAKLGFERSGV